MDKRFWQNMMLVAFGVVLFVALSHLNVVRDFLSWLWTLAMPVILGIIMAFFLNVPMKGIEKGIHFLFRKCKRRLPERVGQWIALFLTLLIIGFLLFLVGFLVLPELVKTVSSIINVAVDKVPEWIDWLNGYGIDTTWLSAQLAQLDIGRLVQSITSSAGNVVVTLINTATSAVGVFTTVLFAFIIALYILTSKKTLSRQGKKLLYAFVKRPIADRVWELGTLLNDTYSRFLSGQCVEAVILGLLMFLSFTICGMPYASVIAVMTAVLSFIPYVGAFFACLIGALLILMIDPTQALMSIILYQVVQFVEGQFIYPRVVGNSVGLPPLWTLIAAILGGKLLGIVGMIFFIPLTAVIFTLIKRQVDARQQKQEEAG